MSEKKIKRNFATLFGCEASQVFKGQVIQINGFKITIKVGDKKIQTTFQTQKKVDLKNFGDHGKIALVETHESIFPETEVLVVVKTGGKISAFTSLQLFSKFFGILEDGKWVRVSESLKDRHSLKTVVVNHMITTTGKILQGHDPFEDSKEDRRFLRTYTICKFENDSPESFSGTWVPCNEISIKRKFTGRYDHVKPIKVDKKLSVSVQSDTRLKTAAEIALAKYS